VHGNFCLTVYLERAVASLSEQKTEIRPELLAHISPLGWEHIGLTGDYTWHENKRVAQAVLGRYVSPPKQIFGLSMLKFPFRRLVAQIAWNNIDKKGS
jgi:hypothetical protein